MDNEIWVVENGRLTVHAVQDLTPTFKRNYEERKEAGKNIGWSGEGQKYARMPLRVLLNDPLAKEGFMNGNKRAQRLFLELEPRYKCAE